MDKYFKKFKYNKFAIACIGMFILLSLATIVRWSTWHDESYSYMIISESFSDIIRRTAFDVHPPMYYLVLKTWSLIFGDSLLSLRLLSLIFMVVAIIMTYRLLLKFLPKKSADFGLMAMSLGPYLIRYSQEIRMYAFCSMLVSISVFYFYEIFIENKQKLSKYILVIVPLVIGVLSHYFVFFALISMGSFLLIRNITNKEKFMNKNVFFYIPYDFYAIASLVIVAFAAWLPKALVQFREVKGNFWIGPIKIETITSYINNFVIYRKDWELSGWFAVIGIVTIALTIWVLVLGIRRLLSVKSQKGLFIIVMAIMPIILLIAVSLPPLQPAFHERYLVYFGMYFYSVVGIGIYELLKNKKYSLISFSYIGLIIFGVINASLIGNNLGWRPSPHFTMNEISAHIDKNINEQDRLLGTSMWVYFDLKFQYRELRNTPLLYVGDKPIGQYGNGSVIFDRTELQVSELNDIRLTDGVDGLWVLEERGLKDKLQADLQVLGWEKINDRTRDFGYASISYYKNNK